MTPPPFEQADFVIITALPKEVQAVVNRLVLLRDFKEDWPGNQI